MNLAFKIILFLFFVLAVSKKHFKPQDYDEAFNNKFLKEEWEDYKKENRRNWSANKKDKDISEDEERFENWLDSWVKVKNHTDTNWKRVINEFSDLTSEERQSFTNAKYDTSKKKSPPLSKFINKLIGQQTSPEVKDSNRLLQSYPSSVDWRAKSKVTPVKNQGKCGSCWAFSAIGAIESLALITNSSFTNATANFSEQQLVDCDTWSADGCNGGDPGSAIDWQTFNGTVSSSDYPYVSGVTKLPSTNQCKPYTKRFTIYGSKSLSPGKTADEELELVAALNEQPISVIIYVGSTFMSYGGGIYSVCNSTLKGNHAVLLVGYTEDSWIIKNSWGSRWGENGFLRYDRKNKECLGELTQWANYPVREKRADAFSSCKYYKSYCWNPDYFYWTMENCYTTCGY